MVKLRLKRYGRRNRAFFRLNAIDSRSPRDGRSIEELGWYDPWRQDDNFKFNTDRIQYWLGVGAQTSPTVAALLRKAGIEHKTIAERKPVKRGERKKKA